jgi:Cd2+/Zn2+-exporting ATPase
MGNVSELEFHISGMDCAACARNVETGVRKLSGVEASSLSFTSELLRVKGTAAPEAVVERVRELGYDAHDPADRLERSVGSSSHFIQFAWRRTNTRLALLGALLILPGLIFNELLPVLEVESPLLNLLSVGALVTAGYPVGLSAWRSLRINREININVLMSVASVGALFIGAYTEAGLVMVLFALGEALEGYTAARARVSIRTLMELVPSKATILRPCIDCAGHLGKDGYEGGPCPFCGLEEQRVPVETLQVGDLIVVKPGERIPMDGRVVSGMSTANQAPITGESRLISKQRDDELFAGSINGSGALEVEVTHLAKDNTISRLIKMVQEAQDRKAPAQRFVDRFAKIYTPLVVLLAALVAVVPPILLGEPFLNPSGGVQGWLYRALALLVVACPCALVISTPVTLVSAISNGARRGILFKGGVYLEVLSRVKAVAFDKTGTLTRGEPSVVSVRSVDCTTPESGDCDECDDLVALAGAVERRSEHPLARAVLAESTQRGVDHLYPSAESVTSMTGQGVRGQVNGKNVFIGNHAYFDAHIPHPSHCESVAISDETGHTTMLVSEGDSYAGYIAVADAVRESSRDAVETLRRLGIESVTMITGDNEATAHAVGRQVGVTDVQPNCLPEGKVAAVKKLQRSHGYVAMVGDGINDAPALATASVGIAIGNTAQAMETADVTLMGNDLRQLPFAIRLSRAAMNTVYVNVALSILIKVAFLVLVVAGLGSMWLAVLADMGTSLIVTLNGMRLLNHPRWSTGGG